MPSLQEAYLNADLTRAQNEIERLRLALRQIRELETLDDGKLSHSGIIADQALKP